MITHNFANSKANLYYRQLVSAHMTYFINKHFLSHVLKEQGQQHLLSTAQLNTLKILVELETRAVLESSIKFMQKDRRETLEAEDVSLAALDSGHRNLTLEALQTANQDSNEQGKIENVTAQGLKEEIEELASLQVEKPQLVGRWVYYQGKVPKLNSNSGIRSLSGTIEQTHENEERKKLVNVIKDDPYSLLTTEQLDYFQLMCEAMTSNINPKGNFTVEGDLNSLLPFFLKFLGQQQLNGTSICFLLKLIDNKYIWQGIEYYLKKILNILLVYRGRFSFEVGTAIGSLVDRFSNKYPILRDIFVGYEDGSYSTILKKISFELRVGIPLQLDEKTYRQCEKDCLDNDEMASLCHQALQDYSCRLKVFEGETRLRMKTYAYWLPCDELKGDPYLRMI